ncbi:MAG TPA: hypothetical protein VLO30_06095, partial [Chthoniobacterales bacterium]|nr:hypothetical protein [Chthoniobacterales bacterium]
MKTIGVPARSSSPKRRPWLSEQLAESVAEVSHGLIGIDLVWGAQAASLHRPAACRADDVNAEGLLTEGPRQAV